MTYRGANIKRLEFLLSSGLEPRELADLYKATRPKLLAAGAKLHKVSKKREDRIRFFARLDGRPADVVADWIANHVDGDIDLLPEALVAQFKAVEESGGTLKDDQAAKFARAGLRYLYMPEPPSVWVAFLATPIGQATDKTQQGASREDAGTDEGAESETPLSVEVVAEIADIVESSASAKPRNVDLLSPAAIATRLLIDLHKDPSLDIAEIASSHEQALLGVAAINAVASRAESWRSAKQHFGLRRQECRDVSELSDLDGDGAQIVGICVGRTPVGSAVFVEPLGVVIGRDIWALDKGTSMRLFPESGKVIGFSNTRGLRLPEVGEFGIWTVERYATPQAIKVRLRQIGAPFFNIVEIPFSAKEPDSVRVALRKADVPKGGRPLFLLKDDKLVKPQGDVADLPGYGFDEPLEAWRSMNGWIVGDRTLVVAPLPPPDHMLDCADLTVVLKKLIGQADIVAKLPAMTRAQVRSFLEAVEASGAGLTGTRLRRIDAELEGFLEDRARLASVVDVLLDHPRVEEELQKVKQRFVDAFEESRADLVAKKAQLEEEIHRLGAKKKEIQDQSAESAAKVSQAIRKAFEKAKAAGIDTLAEAAVIGAIVGPMEGGTGAPIPDKRLRYALAESSEGQGVQTLRELGFRMTDAKFVMALAETALTRGMSLGLTGPGSSLIAARLGKSLSAGKCAIIDIGVGVLSSAEFDDLLAIAEREATVIVIRGVNCSDFSAYGIRLEERLVDRLNHAASTPGFICAFADGPTALPIPQMLRDLCLILDMSAYEGSAEAIDVQLDELLEEPDVERQRPARRLKNRVLKKVLSDLRDQDVPVDSLVRIAANNI